MIFVIIIIGIVGSASAKAKNSGCCTPKQYNQNQNYNREVMRFNPHATRTLYGSNPYNTKTSSISVVRPIYIEDAEPEIPTANFCQYCGTKKDRNAIYCHSCGTKL
jgi:hypothetical protein